MHVTEEQAPRARGFVDRLGVVASLLCLIHCLATPLVVALLPVVAGERFEGVLSLVLIALATISAGASWRRGLRLPLVTYALGLGALGLRAALARAEGDPLDTVLVLAAACALIITHLLGLRAGSVGRDHHMSDGTCREIPPHPANHHRPPAAPEGEPTGPALAG